MARASNPRAYRHVAAVEVHLWGMHIGSVALDPAFGFYAFAYTPEFVARGIEPAPLRMPARADAPYLFVDLPEATYQRLPALLGDALPDAFGNALIDRYMAEQGIAASAVTPLDRLAYMGDRGMGALSFKPARGPARHKPTVIELGALVEAARRALNGAADGGFGSGVALRNLIEVGTSAGGARAKAVIAWRPETGEIRSGQLEAPEGFEHWLLKFDGMGRDRELGLTRNYGRVEYAYHLMARAAGLRMTDCRLLEENGRAHFMTRRFDREGRSERHHLQTLCAMAHLDYRRKGSNAYAQLFTTVIELGLPYADLEEAYRRMVFNVLARNCDDHTKNFSFLLRRARGLWELAPAYDITFAHNPHGEWTNQHLMAVNGKFTGIGIDDLLAESGRFGIGTARRVIDGVRAALEQWPRLAGQAGVPEAQMTRIGGLFARLAPPMPARAGRAGRALRQADR